MVDVDDLIELEGAPPKGQFEFPLDRCDVVSLEQERKNIRQNLRALQPLLLEELLLGNAEFVAQGPYLLGVGLCFGQG